MKTRNIILTTAVVAFSVIGITGCNKAANTNNANNSNTTAGNASTPANTPATKITPAATSTSDYSSPEATLKSFYNASKANDIEGLKRAMSKSTLDTLTSFAAIDKKTLDDSLKEIIKDAPGSMPELRDLKIEGDKATGEIKDDKLEKWTKAYFVKEDGLWKIDMGNENKSDTGMSDHSNMDKK